MSYFALKRVLKLVELGKCNGSTYKDLVKKKGDSLSKDQIFWPIKTGGNT